jgi:cytochrome oxidase Cu insertion factor (SCO1/SenC/PrrC family)
MSLCRIVLPCLILSFFVVQPAEAQSSSSTANRDRATTTPSPHFTWITQYDQALEEARRTGKPLLLTFRCVP